MQPAAIGEFERFCGVLRLADRNVSEWHFVGIASLVGASIPTSIPTLFPAWGILADGGDDVTSQVGVFSRVSHGREHLRTLSGARGGNRTPTPCGTRF